MSSFIDDIKSPFRAGNTVGQLMVVNIAIFLVIVIFRLILTLSLAPEINSLVFYNVISWIAIPMSFGELLYKPWTILTYMFTHYELQHIFWNMLVLFIFGRILQEYAGSKRILAIYLYGGLVGAILAITAYHTIPAFSFYSPASNMVGASAGIMAIVIASATLTPDYAMHLFILGPVRLKFIALFVVVLDLIAITYNDKIGHLDNTGGHLSHLGGALFGYLFIVQMKKGRDLSSGFNSVLFRIKNLFNKRAKIKVVHKRSVSDEDYNIKRKIKQEEIDSILDKISTSGYESLTKLEKEILFKASNEGK